MGAEAAEGLRVGEDRRRWQAEDVPQVDADEGVEQGGVLTDRWIERLPVRLVGAVEQETEALVAVGEREDHPADCAGGAVAPSDVVVDEEGVEHLVACRQRAALAGHRHDVARRVEAGLPHRLRDERLVGEGLKGGAALRYEDEERLLQIEAAEDLGPIIGIDVADEVGIEGNKMGMGGPPLEGEVEGTRTEVAAADADLHDGGEAFAGRAEHRAVAHLFAEGLDLCQLTGIEGALVLTVDDDRVALRSSGEVVEHLPLLAGVHHRSAEEEAVLFDEGGFITETLQHRQVLFTHRHRRPVIAE